MGILDVILGRDQNGKASKINMALIALMLWKMYQGTKGRAAPQPAPAPSPSGRRAEIPAPQPHQQTPQQRQPLPAPDMSDGPDGGFKDLQDSMRRAPQYRRDTGGESGGGGLGGGGLGDILGDILGGGRARPQAEPKAGPAGGGQGGGLGGGLDDILGEILGGGRSGSPRGGGGGGLGGGGLGDILGDLLGGGRPAGGARAMSEHSMSDSSPQGDPLSALLRGAGGAGLGGLLGAGLGGLLQQFEDAGHGERAQSWISSGGNKPLSAADIEQTFGADTIEAIAQQVGLPRSELLAGLAEALPQAVDQMTPDGRMPTPDEWSRWS